eukprot:TRINITY_DN745_c0_g1_i1.p1 TRINITY_DN745_c0_g1~~TRINITY_DN745_c0_g1_i1.p1  ORF type:complete len:737 (+),score=147.28 TRINITY_DN745_c0_g1_i1:72-2282(+)
MADSSTTDQDTSQPVELPAPVESPESPPKEAPTEETPAASEGAQKVESPPREDEVRQKPQTGMKFLPRNKVWTTNPSEGVDLLMSEDGIGAMPPTTVIELFKDTCKSYSSTIAICEKIDDQKLYTGYTYQEYWDKSWYAARAMRKLGLEPYRAVCVVGFNSHEWFVACIASMLAGGMCAGVYTTNSPDACAYVAQDCRAQLYFVEDDKQLQKIIQIRDKLPDLRCIIQFKGQLTGQHENVMLWQDFLDSGKPMATTKTEGKNEEDSRPPRDELDDALDTIIKEVTPERCALLIYTSGTTGNPKGVMLSHDNLMFTVAALRRFNPDFKTGDEQVVSYLPLSHIAAQLADIYIPISTAATVWVAGKDALKGGLAKTLQEVRPTFFFGVPRVWEKVEERIKSELAKSTGFKAKIASWGMEKGKIGNANKQKNEAVPWGWFFASKLVFSKVRAKLGLDRCRIQITGAAPTSPQTLEFFSSIDIPLYELYGMSESTGIQVLNLPQPNIWKTGSVGKPYTGIEMAIDHPDADGNGEIITKGRHVFMGYLGLPDKTRQVIDEDGWLHTEDIGRKDKDGFYYITGRIKEIIITAGGENIPPVMIENTVKSELPFISNIMVIGDRRKFLSAIITLQLVMDENSGYPTQEISPLARDLLAAIGCKATTVSEVIDDKNGNDVVFKAIQEGIDRANKQATSNAQRINKWSLLDTDFSISGGELGPTMKLKRSYVDKKYQGTIEAFYAD